MGLFLLRLPWHFPDLGDVQVQSANRARAEIDQVAVTNRIL